MREITLIRHGLTLKLVTGELQSDDPLHDNGRKQAEALQSIINTETAFDLVVVSPLRRALETALIAFQTLNTPMRMDELLQEFNVHQRAWMPLYERHCGTVISQLHDQFEAKFPAVTTAQQPLLTVADGRWWYTPGNFTDQCNMAFGHRDIEPKLSLHELSASQVDPSMLTIQQAALAHSPQVPTLDVPLSCCQRIRLFAQRLALDYTKADSNHRTAIVAHETVFRVLTGLFTMQPCERVRAWLVQLPPLDSMGMAVWPSGADERHQKPGCVDDTQPLHQKPGCVDDTQPLHQKPGCVDGTPLKDGRPRLIGPTDDSASVAAADCPQTVPLQLRVIPQSFVTAIMAPSAPQPVVDVLVLPHEIRRNSEASTTQYGDLNWRNQPLTHPDRHLLPMLTDKMRELMDRLHNGQSDLLLLVGLERDMDVLRKAVQTIATALPNGDDSLRRIWTELGTGVADGVGVAQQLIAALVALAKSQGGEVNVQIRLLVL
eukprot:TRINITY_DN4638_c0_g1_i2.p1 TRINITY_DN4638_c0_g1~~TRINITY_DN4638_c0_g1_i2.p1  ORF type:complete len:489 (+),score=61.09 TRINITY_DN4638_c0_g1_i2:55-1521(+)